MALVFHPRHALIRQLSGKSTPIRHFLPGSHHRFWLVATAALAFLLAALWASPLQ